MTSFLRFSFMVYVNSIKRLILKRIFGASRGFCFLYTHFWLLLQYEQNPT